MDLSPEFIKMCERADEIQKYKPKPPKYSNSLPPERIEVDPDGNFYSLKHLPKHIVKRTWLPRQDQLQEMMGSDWIKTFDSFTWWVDTHYGTGVDEFAFEKCDDFSSMEQLWLAFVMSEKGKIWDGETWKQK